MIIYRIENEFGFGPYYGPDALGYTYLHGPCESLPNNRPMPEINDLDHTKHYGFNSITQTKKWFGKKVRKKLKEKNYFLAVYQIKKIKKLKKQIMFDKKCAKFISKFDLEEI